MNKKKKTTDDCIHDVFDLPKEQETTEVDVVKKGVEENSDIVTYQKGQRTSNTLEREKLEDDFEAARISLYDTMNKGSRLLEDFEQIASSSQQPRAIEVFAGLMRAINESTTSLINLHKDKQLMEKREQEGRPKQPQNVTNNNLFATTDDILKLIEPKKPKSVEELLEKDRDARK